MAHSSKEVQTRIARVRSIYDSALQKHFESFHQETQVSQTLGQVSNTLDQVRNELKLIRDARHSDLEVIVKVIESRTEALQRDFERRLERHEALFAEQLAKLADTLQQQQQQPPQRPYANARKGSAFEAVPLTGTSATAAVNERRTSLAAPPGAAASIHSEDTGSYDQALSAPTRARELQPPKPPAVTTFTEDSELVAAATELREVLRYVSEDFEPHRQKPETFRKLVDHLTHLRDNLWDDWRNMLFPMALDPQQPRGAKHAKVIPAKENWQARIRPEYGDDTLLHMVASLVEYVEQHSRDATKYYTDFHLQIAGRTAQMVLTYVLQVSSIGTMVTASRLTV